MKWLNGATSSAALFLGLRERGYKPDPERLGRLRARAKEIRRRYAADGIVLNGTAKETPPASSPLAALASREHPPD